MKVFLLCGTPSREEERGRACTSCLFSPLLEEASPLAAAVGAPEVAPAGAVVAAVVGAVVARPRAADA